LLTAVQQVADSLIEWRQSLGNITIQEQALQTANAESTLSDIRYKAGLSSLDGVIEADASLISQCWKMS
jgi:outer membrane protein TolC